MGADYTASRYWRGFYLEEQSLSVPKSPRKDKKRARDSKAIEELTTREYSRSD